MSRISEDNGPDSIFALCTRVGAFEGTVPQQVTIQRPLMRGSAPAIRVINHDSNTTIGRYSDSQVSP